jgi:hypothetical protein
MVAVFIGQDLANPELKVSLSNADAVRIAEAVAEGERFRVRPAYFRGAFGE